MSVEPVAVPINGVLDLHAFAPSETADLVREYLTACRAAGVLQVRIIHGKGTGTQRRIVRSVLGKIPWVAKVGDGGDSGGGWGATVVDLMPEDS